MMFDGLLDTADLITLDIIMENLPEQHRIKFIEEMKRDKPEEWEEYLDHREYMGYPQLWFYDGFTSILFWTHHSKTFISNESGSIFWDAVWYGLDGIV